MDITHEVIIIGGGAAGLSAALMLGRARRRVVVVDSLEPRNRFAATMHGVLGHDGLPPDELLRRGRAEVQGYGVEIVDAAVDRVDLVDGGVLAILEDGRTLRARVVIVATGLVDDLSAIPGVAQRWGSRVLHCPYCHGWEVQDQRFGVVMTSPMSMHQALLVRQWTDRVVAFTAGAGELGGDALRQLQARGITVVGSPVLAVDGDDTAPLAVHTADGGITEVDVIFTGGVLRPREHAVAHLELARTDTPVGSVIAADAMGATSDPRVWLAGNIANPMATVTVAMAAGSTAGAAVNASLVMAETAAAVGALDQR